MVCKRPGTAFLERVQQVGEILPCRLVLRRKACKIGNVVRLRTFSDKDLIAVRVAADKVLVDEEKRRVVLREGSPPFAAAVAAGPGTGCGERRPLPCRRLLSCRLRVETAVSDVPSSAEALSAASPAVRRPYIRPAGEPRGRSLR